MDVIGLNPMYDAPPTHKYEQQGCDMSWLRSLNLVLLGVFSLQLAAQAQVPANDSWANATAISSLPFSTTEADMYLATVEATDPVPPCLPYGTNEAHTLWYSYTTGASTEYVTLLIPNNKILGMITVYTGSPGAFAIVAGGCEGYAEGPRITRIAGLRLAPNTTYSIKVGAIINISSSNTLSFNVTAATQYLVNTTTDSDDGGCNGTICSLRDAISASNVNPGAVIIPAGTYTLSLAGGGEDDNATGDLDARYGMGIYGAGMTQTIIDANHIDRVLHLDSHGSGSASFSVGDLTLRNGNAVGSGQQHSRYGGGLLVRSSGSVDYIGVERVAALSNFAKELGGGFYIGAPGTIRESLVSNNSVNLYYGGGLFYQYDTSGYLFVSGSTFSANSAPDGANGFGGGIYAQGTLLLSNSSVSGNHAGHQGGGIVSQSNGSLTMISSTIVFNSAGTNPNATQVGGGVYINGAAYNPANAISNSIIAYNTVANPNDPPDCAIGHDSPIFSSNYNHVQYPNNCGFTGMGDITGVDPRVSPALAYNGGPTPTHALLSNSPALNTANPAGCNDPFDNALTYDQRGAGFPRVVGAACDKGAIESPIVTPPGPPAMDPTSDSGSSNTDGITNVTTPNFTGTCDNGTTVQLLVDAANVLPATACTSGSYAISVASPIADGVHVITATANNGSVTSLQSAPLTVIIDTSAPMPSFVATPPNPDTNPNPSIAFSANESGNTFTCSLDSSTYTACASPQSLSVAVGAHTFSVIATDLAGNVVASPTTYLWTVLPPTPTAPALAQGSDSGLSESDEITNSAVPVFTGGCTDGDSMQLMASAQPLGTPGICSGSTYAIGIALAEGSHLISVTASRMGYSGAASPPLSVLVDRTAPLAPTITGPGGLVGPAAQIIGTATETTGLITVTEGSTTVCTMAGPFASGNWSCVPGFTTGGVHVLGATQTDMAGNVSTASTSFNILLDIIFKNGFEQ